MNDDINTSTPVPPSAMQASLFEEPENPNLEVGFSIDEDTFDPALSKQGVWVDFHKKSRLKIASSETSTYKAELTRLAKRNKVMLDSTSPESIEIVQAITVQCLAKYVLLDWEHIIIGGAEVPYSIDVGIKALTASKTLRDFVSEQASVAANFQKQVADAVAK